MVSDRLRSIYDLLTTTYAIHCDHRYEHIYVSCVNFKRLAVINDRNVGNLDTWITDELTEIIVTSDK